MEEKLFSFLMDCSSPDGINLMSLEDSSLPSSKGDSLLCKLCNCCYSTPRVLSCLHTFCEKCLEKELTSHGKQAPSMLKCPSCRHETKLTSKGIADLPLDYVTCNEIDLYRAENKQIFCTSCKAQEKAVGRCSDCSSFLCLQCVTAHQYMRCFENHKVISFEEMKKSGDCLPFHSPIKCSIHCNEMMKYFCHTCQELICSECIVVNHQRPEHDYERFQDTEEKVREELQSLIAESKSKMQFCADVSLTLNSSLAELQSQRDDAKSLIMETYQSYKAILEKCQEDVLKELALLHSAEELKIMEYSHHIDETLSKMEHACKFSDILLNKGNCVELMSLKKVVKAQLLYLINNTPKPELNFEIKFDTDAAKFEKAVKDNFGKLRKPVPPSLKPTESISSHQTSPLHSSSSFDSDGFGSLSAGILSPDEVPPLEVDLPNNFVAQYNIAQLVGIAERSSSRGSLNSTEIPSSLNELLVQTTASQQTLGQKNTLDTVAVQTKFGTLSLTNTGQQSFTCQKPPIMSMENMTPQSCMTSNLLSSPRSFHDMISPTVESNIAGLLNGRHNLPQSMNSTSLDNNTLLNGSINSLSHRVVSTPPRISPNVPSVSSHPIFNSSLCPAPKSNTMQIRCKFGQLGSSNGQFSSPHGFCLGLDQEIIVADTNNHRIQVFDKMGEFKFHFGIAGKEEGQLWYPRKVAVIRPSGKYVICDRGSERSRMQIFTKAGHFIRKIAIRYIDIVAGLAITADNNIVAVDSVSPTVFVISEAGELIHWFDCSEFMREPSDIAVSGKEFYICDFKGHCVSVFSENGQFQRRIGCESVTNFPNGIDISDAGDILVGDSHGNRFHVVVFSKEGYMTSEYECPYVKVSRCCGLKITSEGYIVTLAKNNHHVLILNTLYVL